MVVFDRKGTVRLQSFFAVSGIQAWPRRHSQDQAGQEGMQEVGEQQTIQNTAGSSGEKPAPVGKIRPGYLHHR